MQEFVKKIMSEFSINIDVGMSRDIRAFLTGYKEILEYTVEVDETKTIFINIRLQKYNDALAQNLWKRFVDFIGYEYFNLYIKDEKQSQIKYSYITGNDDMEGVRIEMVIE